MTTTERAPQVWRGYDALAQVGEPIGSHYSPNALIILRWLALQPGSTAAVLCRVHQRKSHKVAATLRRLVALELVRSTSTSMAPGRWWLTEHGRELVALIDEEGIT